MADLSKQRERMWLSALREIGLHFSKIGDIITKCADDTENLPSLPYPPHKAAERGREHPRLQKPKQVDEPRPFRSPDTFARYPGTSEARPAGGPSSYHRAKHISPKEPGREFPKHISRNGRVPIAHPPEVEEEEDDEMLSERFRGRKRSSAGIDRHSYEERQRRDSAHYPIGRRASRPMKRVRMNWTEAENTTFFDTIRRFATEDDNAVLHKIVAALGGSRTLIQCKGHFRNMLVVGKVVQSEEEPRRWMVVDEPGEKRTTLAGKSPNTDSKNSRSSGGSREDPASRSRDRDDPDDERLKGSRADDRGHSSQHHDDNKAIDDEDDVVLDDIEEDDDRDKDYQDDEGMDDDDGDEEENESGTNNTAVRVTDVGDIDPGGAGAEYGNPSMGSSVRNIDDGTGKTSNMPLKKQPGGRVGELAAAQSIHDKKELH